MEYMIMIHGDETAQAPGFGEPDFDEFMGAWLAFNQKLIDGGHFVSAANLQPTSTATTIRRGPSGDTIIDGPFAETKEQFGGYYLITASDLDEAIALAKSLPLPVGSIEVRPIALRPDAA